MLVAVCCTFVIFIFYFFGHCSILRFGFGRDSKKKREKKKGVKGFSIIFTFFLLSHGVPPVPSGPPRKVEVEAVNSSSIKVIWRSPMPTKQHGQIRGYQVHYVRMVNGEPTGQPAIKDILIDDAQVQHPHPTLSQPATTSETHNVFLTHNYKLLLCKPDYLFSLVVTCFATNENSVGHTRLFICMWMIISAFAVNILWKNCI